MFDSAITPTDAAEGGFITATPVAPRGVVTQKVPDDLLPNIGQNLRVGPPNELIMETDKANRAALKSRMFWLYPDSSSPQYDWLRDENNSPIDWLFNARLKSIEIDTVTYTGGDSLVVDKLITVFDFDAVQYTFRNMVNSTFARTLITGLAGLLESGDGIGAPFHLRAAISKKTTAEQFESDRPLPYYASLRIPGVKHDNWLDNYYSSSDVKDRFTEIYELKRNAKTKVAAAQAADANAELMRDQVQDLQAALDQVNGVIDA